MRASTDPGCSPAGLTPAAGIDTLVVGNTVLNDRIHFVGIGAPKSGTTWLSACLAEHPEVGFARDKEVYFFADSEARTYFRAGFDYYARGSSWYHQQFRASAPTARVFGEYSVSYMYDPRACERIADYNREIKILVALRNPVDIVYSWYWYNKTGLISNLPDSFEGLMEIEYFRNLGCYHRALKPFFDTFPAENIHVALHDDIREDPDAVLRGVFEFLGVDPGFRPAGSGERINAAKTTRFRGLQRIGNLTYRTMSRLPVVSSVVTSRPFEKAVLKLYGAVNHVPLKYPPMRPETRRELSEFYRSDVARLESLVGRDLNAWCSRD